MTKHDDHLEQLALAERRGRARSAASPSRAKASPSNSPAAPDQFHRSRSVDEIAERLEASKTATADERRRLKKISLAVGRATRRDGTGQEIGGTGFTVLKIRQKPMETLIVKGRIGSEEITAADEILLAVQALTSRLMIRGQAYERVDGGRPDDVPWPLRTAGAVGRYQAWATYWSARKVAGDPTLPIIIAAVVDEHPIRTIAADVGYHHKRVERAICRGLRDYAARAQMVTRYRARKWIDEAKLTFPIVENGGLRLAVAAARVSL